MYETIHKCICQRYKKRNEQGLKSLHIFLGSHNLTFGVLLEQPSRVPQSGWSFFEHTFSSALEAMLCELFDVQRLFISSRSLCFSDVSLKSTIAKISSDRYETVINTLAQLLHEFHRFEYRHDEEKGTCTATLEEILEWFLNSECFFLEYIGYKLKRYSHDCNSKTAIDYEFLIGFIANCPNQEPRSTRIEPLQYDIYYPDFGTIDISRETISINSRYHNIDILDADNIPASVEWPIGFEGYHSSWRDKEHDPSKTLIVSQRRVVPLNVVSCKLETVWGDGEFPFVVKGAVTANSIFGLTSGAGGALIPTNHGVIKIKRCGYKLSGVRLNSLRDKKLVLTDRELFESSIFSPAGLGHTDSLISEINSMEMAAKGGFSLANKPLLLQNVDTKLNLAFMVCSVASDLRVDEVLLTIIKSPDISSSLKVYAAHEIGKADGCLYHQFHQAGFIRSMGNSWEVRVLSRSRPFRERSRSTCRFRAIMKSQGTRGRSVQ